MDILQKDIHEYINDNLNEYHYLEDIEQQLHISCAIKSNLYHIYSDTDISTVKKYVIDNIVDQYINDKNINDKNIKERKEKLKKLKQLKLPDQRTPEWYEMRKNKLTASSLSSAIGHGYFTTRDELLLDKIIEKPYESNPITEHGVKYEEVATRLYEELYNTKIVEFGMVPHPKFEAFGASPDGICDDMGNDEYVGRMIEIKCPPKRKFTKTVPPHYLQQVLGQLEVCDLDECDFFQVKIEDYESYENYKKDIFVIDDMIMPGRNSQNYPKGVTITYKQGETLSYVYSDFNKTDEEHIEWISNQSTENLFEIKWWTITRYETTLVKRDKKWWINVIDKIVLFYQDLLDYRSGDKDIEELKQRVIESKKRKKKEQLISLNDFELLD